MLRHMMITVFGFFFLVFISFVVATVTLLSFLFTTWLPCKVEGKTSAEFLILETGIVPPPKLQRNKKDSEQQQQQEEERKRAHFNFCSILVHARLRWMR